MTRQKLIIQKVPEVQALNFTVTKYLFSIKLYQEYFGVRTHVEIKWSFRKYYFFHTQTVELTLYSQLFKYFVILAEAAERF